MKKKFQIQITKGIEIITKLRLKSMFTPEELNTLGWNADLTPEELQYLEEQSQKPEALHRKKIESNVKNYLCEVFGKEVCDQKLDISQIKDDYDTWPDNDMREWLARIDNSLIEIQNQEGYDNNLYWADNFFSSKLVDYVIYADILERHFRKPYDDSISKLKLLLCLQKSDEVKIKGQAKGVPVDSIELDDRLKNWLVEELKLELFGEENSFEWQMTKELYQNDAKKMLESFLSDNQPRYFGYRHFLGAVMSGWCWELEDCSVVPKDSKKKFCESNYERYVFCYDLAVCYELIDNNRNFEKKDKYDCVKEILNTYNRQEKKRYNQKK